ncbi:MAG: UDP-glucose/GDP-mannose dehydrogenase family protein [Candidatus Uhrbacteria bacterium]
MKIAVFGTGYVGLVTGVGFAEMGNNVTCIDIDERKIAQLAAGIPTIHESGLAELLTRNLREGRLSFTIDSARAVRAAEVVFIAVGTPSLSDGSADCSQIEAVGRVIGTAIDQYQVVIVKSTAPPGTAERLEAQIRAAVGRRRITGAAIPDPVVDVAVNPEFLREGAAIKDFLNPDRVIVGFASEQARSILERLYRPIVRMGRPVVWMDRKSAALTKYAANAFLATKISFINEIAALCDMIGADVASVAKGMGFDSRIGSRFLHAGIGWGGSCFPKDVAALGQFATESGVTVRLPLAAMTVNSAQCERFVAIIRKVLGDLVGRTIAVWGASFKPRTDDVRDSPALTIVSSLVQNGAIVRLFDPVARDSAARALSRHEHIEFPLSMYEAIDGVDALCICTEWDEFRSPDFERMRACMRSPIIFDGRNIYEPSELQAQGFRYYALGRSCGQHVDAVVTCAITNDVRELS